MLKPMTADDEGTGDLLVAYAESTLKSRRLRREVAEIVERLKTLIASLEDDPAIRKHQGRYLQYAVEENPGVVRPVVRFGGEGGGTLTGRE